jgi:hypothetical protein
VATPTPLSQGTYEAEINRTFHAGESEHAMTLKLQITVNSDGTYLEQGYVTVHGTEIKDRLATEEKGNYSQTGDQLITSERLERKLNVETNAWSAWSVPASGSEDTDRIRNITSTTFQIYDPQEKAWFTFSKL